MRVCNHEGLLRRFRLRSDVQQIMLLMHLIYESLVLAKPIEFLDLCLIVARYCKTLFSDLNGNSKSVELT